MTALPVAYNRPSGRFSPTGLLIALIFGAIGGAIGALIYSYLIFYNPFIYINFLTIFGFALVIGTSVSIGISPGKVRNPTIATLLGEIAGAFAVYASWAWIHAFAADSAETSVEKT